MNYSHASSSSFLPHHSLLSQPLASNHCTTNSAETTNISSAASRPLCGAADTLSITDTNKPSLFTVIGLTTSRKSDSGETLHLNTLCHTDVLPPPPSPLHTCHSKHILFHSCSPEALYSVPATSSSAPLGNVAPIALRR